MGERKNLFTAMNDEALCVAISACRNCLVYIAPGRSSAREREAEYLRCLHEGPPPELRRAAAGNLPPLAGTSRKQTKVALFPQVPELH